MKVKRFVAPNMRSALRQVREEMGPEAVILSNKRISGGVEILTAVESAAAPATVDEEGPGSPAPAANPLARELEQMQQQSRQRARELAQRFAPQSALAEQADSQPARQQQVDNSAANDASMAKEDSLQSLRLELQSMRDLLQRQFAGQAWQRVHDESPARASLWQGLKRIGLSAAVAEQFLTELEPHDALPQQWQSLMKAVSRSIPVHDLDYLSQPACIALLGPSGAGKTTTIGKLATRYVLQQGAESLALVTMDNQRIGGQEQLRTLGRILNVPVKTVDARHSLEQVLYGLRHKQCILIDTPGLGKQPAQLKALKNTLNEQGAQLQSLLVLPASLQDSVLQQSYRHYQVDSLVGCVLTRLDEAASLGPALSVVIEKQLPVCFCSDGQEIPEDLTSPSAAQLLSQAIKLGKSVHAGDADMVEEMLRLQQSANAPAMAS